MSPLDFSLLHLGTSSWTAEGWEGRFYPAKLPESQWIAHYARKFSTVEVDATFYHAPGRKTVQAWRDRTPEGFLFAAKVPQTITHERFLLDCAKETTAFLDTMSILGSRLGPILFQFPYYAKRTGVGLRDFLERLKAFLSGLPREGFRFAVEVRNKTWLKEPLLNLLSEHRIALTLIAHPWMYRPRDLFRLEGVVTAPFVYIRWLGDRRKIEEITTTWDKTVIDREADLREWAGPVENLLERSVEVYGYINNHYSGYAPADVERFVGFLKETGS